MSRRQTQQGESTPISIPIPADVSVDSSCGKDYTFRMDQMELVTSINIAQRALEILSDGCVDDISGSVVTKMERQEDGKLLIVHQGVRTKLYASEFWASQPDGEYQLFITQGGIRNREIPHEEKRALSHFLHPHLPRGKVGNKIFTGSVRLDIYNGAITQVRIQPK